MHFNSKLLLYRAVDAIQLTYFQFVSSSPYGFVNRGLLRERECASRKFKKALFIFCFLLAGFLSFSEFLFSCVPLAMLHHPGNCYALPHWQLNLVCSLSNSDKISFMTMPQIHQHQKTDLPPWKLGSQPYETPSPAQRWHHSQNRASSSEVWILTLWGSPPRFNISKCFRFSAPFQVVPSSRSCYFHKTSASPFAFQLLS